MKRWDTLTTSAGGALSRIGIAPAGAGLMVSAVVAWLLGLALGSRALFLLAYGTVIVVAIAWVLARRRLGIDGVRSELAPRLRAGQTVEVHLDLTARRRVSNVIIEEILPSRLSRSVRVPVTELPPGRTVTHVYRLTPRLRGVYEVGPLMLTWADPFGITKHRRVLVESTQVIVHPATEPVHDRVLTREWEDPPIRPPLSKPWPTGFDFYGMRDYVSGDDPRRIVWRASARMTDPATGMARYLVRESEQGITDRVCLILDTTANNHSPGDPSDTFETSVGALASLAVRHLRDGFAVTVETNGRRLINAARGEHSRIRLLDELARVQLERAPLTEAIKRLSADRRRLNLHSVLITGSLEEEAAARLRQLAHRSSMVVTLIGWSNSDPASLRRAATIGCNVVELEPGMVLESAFRKVVGTGAHFGR